MFRQIIKMKKLLIFAALLTSCTAQWHYQKAINKGMTFEPEIDTVYSQRIDTVWNYETNEIERIDTITVKTIQTIERAKFVNMTARERRALRDSMKHIENILKLENRSLRDQLRAETRQHRASERTERVEVRQTNRTERAKTRRWFWFIFGTGTALLAFIFMNLRKMLINKSAK